MEVAHLDTETRSACDLIKTGAHKYFEHPSTQVICASWRIGKTPVRQWRRGDAPPYELLEHIGRGGKVVAHNNQFDRLAWNRIIAKNYPIAQIAVEQCDCTLARAQAMSLPPALAYLGDALKVKMPKDLDGHRLMMRLCKPRIVHEDGTIEWWDDPADIDRLAQYCDRDVESETEIDGKLPQLTERERQVWILDQKINDRGFCVDTIAAELAWGVVKVAKERADARMAELTNKEITSCGQTKRIVAWLNARGVPCESVAKGETDELILTAQIIDDHAAEEVVQLRRAASRTSTAKFKAILDTACSDGRVRGSLAYSGTYTHRWAGRNLQPQNFPRVDEDAAADAELVLELLATGKPEAEICDAIDMLTGKPMETLSKCLRTMIVADFKKQLVGGDFKNIEGRLSAWFADEQWKIRAFRDFDAGRGPDLYYVTAARILGKPIEAVTKPERQSHGKVPELALGYQGGVHAFHTMAATYGVQLDDGEAYKIVYDWREQHPAIVGAWEELDTAARMAIETKGLTVKALDDKIRFKTFGDFLCMKLPSGTIIYYPAPRLTWEQAKDRDGELLWKDDEKKEPVMRNVMTCMLVENKKLAKSYLYGGALFANAVSGTARDVMVEAMFRLDEDFPLVLTVHDELLSEVDAGSVDINEYRRRMEIIPPWADGCPIVADCWEGKRYAK